MTATDRQKLIHELEDQFAPFTHELCSELRAQHFYFKEQRLAHQFHLDARLVVRHALPYCITEQTYFGSSQPDVQFFAGVILLHSLALTRIDNYYDGGHKAKDICELDVSALAYSLTATHEALDRLLKHAPDTRKLAHLLSVTNFVHSRMYKDYTERYRPEYLLLPEKRIDHYLHSQRSRLLGSGYWEVMARASFVQRAKPFPAHLHAIDIKLRKFRQMIDELADVEEDVCSGLVTLPVLHALAHHKQTAILRSKIIKCWDHKAAEAAGIDTFLHESGTHAWIHKQAMELHDAAMKELDQALGERDEGYRRLFEYKRQKLELLVRG